jgi:hypothetical protein
LPTPASPSTTETPATPPRAGSSSARTRPSSSSDGHPRNLADDQVVVLEIADGRVTAERHYWPLVDALVQLGLVEPPQAQPT